MHNYYGIEAGGTKFICAWGTGPDDLHDRVVIPTTTPAETMMQVVKHIHETLKKTSLIGIGAAVFGPLGLNPDLDSYGFITTTPKAAWQHYDFVGDLYRATNLPVVFDTDVNAAVMGEHHWGAGKNLSDLIYITVGTGIGAGALVNNQLCHGAMHPEMGHIILPKHPADPGKSTCQFHDACFEGLASGPSLNKRWAVDCAMNIPSNHIAWEIEADYLAKALINYTLCFSPKRIIMGGGVMQQAHLFPLMRKKMIDSIAGYVTHPFLEDLSNYVVPPILDRNAGVLGAIALASAQLKSTATEQTVN